jgi:protocatechuate 3,4-dioxygenase beta subunit
VLSGVVKSSEDCSPSRRPALSSGLEPDKKYDDEHRATVFVDAVGAYRFESNFPPGYFGRRSHIHIRVSAEGFRTLVTALSRERRDQGGV